MMPEQLGPALLTISGPSYTASLHLQLDTQRLWLVERGNEAGGEDWSAVASDSSLVTSYGSGTLIVGGRASTPIVAIDATAGLSSRRMSTATAGAWLTSFEDLSLPFELVVRAIDAQGTCVEVATLDFPADAPSMLAARLADAARRTVISLRARLGHLPKRMRSYPS